MAAYDNSSPNSPPSLRQVPSYSRLDNAGARRSMFRGKMSKRLSESMGSSVEMDDHHEADAGRKRASFLRKRKGTNESETFGKCYCVARNTKLILYPGGELKNRISGPFDFQHLSHADRHQVAALEQALGSEKGAGWAERAAQGSSSQTYGSDGPRQISTENLLAAVAGPTSPPQSPRQRFWQQTEFDNISLSSRPELRLTRSVESFSQPGMNLRAHRQSSSVIAPPRTSSLVPAAAIHNMSQQISPAQTSSMSPVIRSKRQSGIWDTFTLPVAPQTEQLLGISEDSTFVGKALTTPDDSAIQALTPPFSPSLEDVAEEPERFVSPRPAPQPPRSKTPTSPRSLFPESFSFRTQRSSDVRTRSRGNSRASPKSSYVNVSSLRPTSQISEALASPSSTRESPVYRPSVARRKSNTWRAIEESWEDDVDYIYEHALEAECDNDWDRISENGDSADPHRALTRAIYEASPPVSQAPQALQYSSNTKPAFQLQMPFLSSRLPPSNDSVPDLGTTASASTAGTGLQTPFHECEGFALSPSLLLPRDYKEAAETSYEDILKEYDGSGCQFPIIDLDESATSSTRSSRVRFSRRSSYDSSLISSAQSSGLWSSPVRRSASSAGSVPELVHSRRTRQNFSQIVDELSEQVASMQAYGSDGEEENDITPPGPSRLSAGRSLHVSAQDMPNNVSYQRNKHTHKQALSDGAAQLPASAGEVRPRARAATTSHMDEEEYLQLFPTPPSFSPPISN